MVNRVFDFDEWNEPLATMSPTEIDGLGSLLRAEAGIVLSYGKRHMVSARLNKRIRELGLRSYGEYLALLNSPAGRASELAMFIDVMTTNKTDFFREPPHFEILVSAVLPQVRKLLEPGGAITIWSAACSTGEEPYSLAMQLYDQFLCLDEGFSILATDICRQALEKAQQAIYSEAAVKNIPVPFARRFLLRGKGHRHGCYRIAPEIRKLVQFARVNLIDDMLPITGPAHIIWCRNVMIYFDMETKKELARKLFRLLAPGGYLFIGHSESLNGLSDEFVPAMPAVYRKPPLRMECRANKSPHRR